jgi:Fe-S-cluster containining protein
MATRNRDRETRKFKQTLRRKREEDLLARLGGDHLEVARAACSTAAGTMREERTRTGVIEAVRTLVSWAEERVAENLRGSPPQQPLACQEGCAYCCHFPLDLTPPELIWISEFLHKIPEPRVLAALEERTARIADQTRGMNAAERTASRLPCPLLVENRCSVYPVRPLLCRGWNSMDVEPCRRVFETGDLEKPIPRYLPQAQIMFLVQLGLMAALHALGYEAVLLECAASLRVVLEDREAARRWLEKGQGFAAARSAGQPSYTSRFWKRLSP